MAVVNAKQFRKNVIEGAAAQLVRALNTYEQAAPERRAELDRVKQLLLGLEELRREERCGGPLCAENLALVNDILSCYAFVTQFLDLGGTLIEVTAEKGRGFHKLDDEIALSQCVLNLASGELERIRQCGYCHAWYFAKRTSKAKTESFCSADHYLRWFRSQPENKEKHKVWQRNYYRDQLSPVTRKSERRGKRS